MSTHPNAMLMVVLKPDDLARKTYRNILNGNDPDGQTDIGNQQYNSIIMEETYNESNQIEAEEGDIVFWNLVTYGYGEKIIWNELSAMKDDLEKWAKDVSEKHHCQFEIYVSANYW